MNLIRFVILLALFIFVAYLVPDMQIALAGLSGAETLAPVLNAVPYVFVGASFFAFFYLGVMGRDE